MPKQQIYELFGTPSERLEKLKQFKGAAIAHRTIISIDEAGNPSQVIEVSTTDYLEFRIKSKHYQR